MSLVLALLLATLAPSHAYQNYRDPYVDPLYPDMEVMDCNGTVSLKHGHSIAIESENFPGELPAYSSCTWKIKVPAKSEVSTYCDKVLLSPGFTSLKLKSTYTNMTAYAGTALETITTKRRRTLKFEFKSFSEYDEAHMGMRCYVSVDPMEKSPAHTSLSLSCGCGLPNKSDRLVGGTPAGDHEYPWLVGLVSDAHWASTNPRKPYCGGTLISDRHVLTTRSCVHFHPGFPDPDPSRMGVLIGEDRLDNNDQEGQFPLYNVSSVALDPLYDSVTSFNDLAVLTLAAPLPLSSSPFHRVAPACLPATAGDNYAGRDAVVAGWGATQPDSDWWDNNHASNTVQEAGVSVITNDECRDLYNTGYHYYNFNLDPYPYIGRMVMCATNDGACLRDGDVGGPLVLMENGRYVVAGVAQRQGPGCIYAAAVPGTYTRVARSLAWVRSVARGTTDSLCNTAD